MRRHHVTSVWSRGACPLSPNSLISTGLRDKFPSHLTRVRTICIGLPQNLQLTAGRGLGSGTVTCLINYTRLTSLLLRGRKPKLLARLNPFGRICSRILRINATQFVCLMINASLLVKVSALIMQDFAQSSL